MNDFRLEVAAPCSASWAQMSGDEKVRFCGLCKKNVYNLSTMSRDEAVGLVRETEGQMCARFYQRSDGTVITADCPVSVRRARFAMTAALSLLALIFVAPMFVLRRGSEAHGEGAMSFHALVSELRQVPVIGVVVNWLSPEPVMMMGDVAP